MTGFGAAEGDVAGGRLRIEIRTVNHRFFNFSPKLPTDLAALEIELREALRREFDRGHIAVYVRWVDSSRRAAGAFQVDLPRAELVAARLREMQAALGLGGEVTVDLVARQSDVLGSAAVEAPAEVPFAEVEPIAQRAAQDCKAMRLREGNALAAELTHRLDLLAQAAQVVEKRAPERLVRERERLTGVVRELVAGQAVDGTRIAQELAIFADKLDITEELVRLRAHLDACRSALAAQKPVGKQLGFLAQELGREVNTIGSKANDAEIAHQVIAMKGELEKFREQLENLE